MINLNAKLNKRRITFSKEDESKFINYLFNVIYNDKPKFSDMKSLINLLIKFCTAKNYPDVNIVKPIVDINQFMEERESGSYSDYFNLININSKLFENFANKDLYERISILINLFDTVGHEMRHYYQNFLTINYNEMKKVNREYIDEKSYEAIKSFDNYFAPKDEDIKNMLDYLEPFMDKKIRYESDESKNKHIEKISFAIYYSLYAEQEAREAGNDFAEQIIDYVLKSDKVDEEGKYYFGYFKDWANRKKYQLNVSLRESKHQINAFNTNFEKISLENILNIVNDFEGPQFKSKSMDIGQYKLMLRLLLKPKSLEEKKVLLKNAIYYGYSQFIGILTDSISHDEYFKEEKQNIDDFCFSCLIGDAYEPKGQTMNMLKSFWCDYSQIMSDENYKNLIEYELKNGFFNIAKSLLTYSERFPKFSTQDLMNINDITINAHKNEANYEVYNFYESILSQLKEEQFYSFINGLFANEEKVRDINLLIRMRQVLARDKSLQNNLYLILIDQDLEAFGKRRLIAKVDSIPEFLIEYYGNIFAQNLNGEDKNNKHTAEGYNIKIDKNFNSYVDSYLKKCEEILNKPKNKLSETKIRNALSILSNYRRVILQRIKIVEKQEGNKFKSLEKRYEMFEMTNEQKKEFAENTELIKEFISIIKTGSLIDNRCKSVKINEKEKFALLLEINDILKIRLTTLFEELNKKEEQQLACAQW